MKIVTSFYPIYAMVKEVSGDLNDVRMIQSSSGIHSFEPSANDIAAIYDADVFVYHSHTLESWAGSLDPNLKKSKVKVLEASEGMTLDRVPGLEDMEAGDGVDEKTLYDPHTWLDPEKAGEEAQIQEPSPRQLTEIQEFVKTYKVKTIFTESNASSKVAETLVKSTGVGLKTLNPLEADPQNDKTYLENLEENMSVLAEELK
ncbi:High-affinity zinc uptake system binding-protein ZnuA precursor [Streptococcus mitis]|uniref:High-affinity zinc uptake system binding-protein ZnuA n=2 Tax=Streptococcus mitis TaxID=28037 RepID=A0A3R9H986_STRMT|nr:High-affinity zinc uptake system binding-protein ZnuA precursor [Streptococcus mitis]